jgi:hypothetical protein
MPGRGGDYAEDQHKQRELWGHASDPFRSDDDAKNIHAFGVKLLSAP